MTTGLQELSFVLPQEANGSIFTSVLQNITTMRTDCTKYGRVCLKMFRLFNVSEEKQANLESGLGQE